MSKSKHTKHMIRRIPKNMTKDEIKNQYKAYKKKTSSLYKIGTKVVIIEVQHEYENGYLGIEGVIAQIKGKRLRVEYNSLGIAKDTIAIFEKIYFQDAIDVKRISWNDNSYITIFYDKTCSQSRRINTGNKLSDYKVIKELVVDDVCADDWEVFSETLT